MFLSYNTDVTFQRFFIFSASTILEAIICNIKMKKSDITYKELKSLITKRLQVLQLSNHRFTMNGGCVISPLNRNTVRLVCLLAKRHCVSKRQKIANNMVNTLLLNFISFELVFYQGTVHSRAQQS